MIRACSNELAKAMLYWRFQANNLKDKAQARKDLAASIMGELLDKFKKRRERWAYNRLAAGVA